MAIAMIAMSTIITLNNSATAAANRMLMLSVLPKKDQINDRSRH